MAHCSPLGEVATANVAETENVAEIENVVEVVPSGGGNEVPMASGDEGHASSGGEMDGSTDEGPPTTRIHGLTISGLVLLPLAALRKMVENGYFVDGEAQAPGTETVPELDDDEAVVFEFFTVGLRMPPHLALADILLKF
jgi:hypothetical protein